MGASMSWNFTGSLITFYFGMFLAFSSINSNPTTFAEQNYLKRNCIYHHSLFCPNDAMATTEDDLPPNTTVRKDLTYDFGEERKEKRLRCEKTGYALKIGTMLMKDIGK
jgi:hypothetical protein